MAEREMVALTGNEAGALAFKQIEPDVVAAYPITPQTELMHDVAQFIHDGEMKTELITVESEHSAMSACIGAASAGARTMTATSGQGLALMWEMLYIAASYRLPIVMANVNRALSGPINIHCDHSDAMGARDTGWIQIYCENSQEIYDTLIQAVRIAENERVRLPVMVCYDGFIISHTMQPLKILTKEEVQEFVGSPKLAFSLLDVEKPFTLGALDLPPYYYEHKRPQVEAMNNALEVVKSVGEEYGKLSSRKYGYFEEYKTGDAEFLIVGLGSFTGTAMEAIDIVREEGIPAGLLKMRLFRPLPKEALAEVFKKVKASCVFDRAISFGLGGPLVHELRSVAYEAGSRLPIASAIYGLGGRDLTEHDIAEHIRKLWNDYKKGKMTNEPVYLTLCE
jgi:pyruvate ferredoxin oxidoreductase alpha subunit